MVCIFSPDQFMIPISVFEGFIILSHQPNAHNLGPITPVRQEDWKRFKKQFQMLTDTHLSHIAVRHYGG